MQQDHHVMPVEGSLIASLSDEGIIARLQFLPCYCMYEAAEHEARVAVELGGQVVHKGSNQEQCLLVGHLCAWSAPGLQVVERFAAVGGVGVFDAALGTYAHRWKRHVSK
jgi:hypothetical protein